MICTTSCNVGDGLDRGGRDLDSDLDGLRGGHLVVEVLFGDVVIVIVIPRDDDTSMPEPMASQGSTFSSTRSPSAASMLSWSWSVVDQRAVDDTASVSTEVAPPPVVRGAPKSKEWQCSGSAAVGSCAETPLPIGSPARFRGV